MNKLRDKVYELEGLLELQALRPEKAMDLRHLIDGRIKEINALWAKETGTESEAEAAEVSDEAYVTSVTDVTGVSEMEDEAEPAVKPDWADESGLDVSVTEEFTVEPQAAARTVPPEDTFPPEAARTIPPEAAFPPEPESRPVPALCLNDRFRFTRVIAGGNRQDFDRILKNVSTLPDYESARDYVLTESHADPDDPEVMDFLEILQQYYE